MEQHPLIPLADAEHITHLGRAASEHVAQRDHLTLRTRQRVDRGLHDVELLTYDRLLLGIGPRVGWLLPRPGLAEPAEATRINRGFVVVNNRCGRERDRPLLLHAARAGDVARGC